MPIFSPHHIVLATMFMYVLLKDKTLMICILHTCFKRSKKLKRRNNLYSLGHFVQVNYLWNNQIYTKFVELACGVEHANTPLFLHKIIIICTIINSVCDMDKFNSGKGWNLLNVLFHKKNGGVDYITWVPACPTCKVVKTVRMDSLTLGITFVLHCIHRYWCCLLDTFLKTIFV